MAEFAGLLGIIAILVFIATMVNPRVGLMLIIFSIILSPEFRIFDRPIRIEDILLIVVILAWIAIMATKGKNFVHTPLNQPILVYLFISFLALANALVFGNISPFTGNPQNVNYSILTLLKKVEYFMVFFVVVNTIKNFKHVRQYIVLMFISCSISNAYALYQGSQMELARVSAPFDPEANTFGQYLMIHILLMISIFSASKNIFQRGLLVTLLVYTLSAFMLTYSRGSYLALLLSALFLGVIRERRILFFIFIAAVFANIIFKSSVIERVSSGVKEVQEWREGTAEPGGNAFISRVTSFQEGFSVALKHPLLGAGIGNVPLNRTEAQIPKEALETGFTGLFAFLWIMFAIARLCWEIIHTTRNDYVHRLSFGMLAILFGCTISGFSAIPFTTIRTAEPFWFLCGLVAACHQLILQGQELPEIEEFEESKTKRYKIHSRWQEQAQTLQ